ncbi:hypothetical protein J4474_02055 [Candidatus Pacearchaeota archaeon]|nr:hypothetical protein [Candidatus Pacearchaeota archaeon]
MRKRLINIKPDDFFKAVKKFTRNSIRTDVSLTERIDYVVKDFLSYYLLNKAYSPFDNQPEQILAPILTESSYESAYFLPFHQGCLHFHYDRHASEQMAIDGIQNSRLGLENLAKEIKDDLGLED